MPRGDIATRDLQPIYTDVFVHVSLWPGCMKWRCCNQQQTINNENNHM